MKLFFYLFMFIASSAFALGYKVERVHDDFEGMDTASLNYDSAREDCAEHLEACPITVGLFFIKKTKESNVFLKITYDGGSWMSLSKDCLKILIDGKPLALTAVAAPKKSIRERGVFEIRHAGNFQEEAIFNLSEENAKLIFKQDSVKIKITGSEGYLVRCIPSNQINNFKRFLSEECGMGDMTFTIGPTPIPGDLRKTKW